MTWWGVGVHVKCLGWMSIVVVGNMGIQGVASHQDTQITSRSHALVLIVMHLMMPLVHSLAMPLITTLFFALPPMGETTTITALVPFSIYLHILYMYIHTSSDVMQN